MIIKDSESVELHTSTGPMRTYLFRPVAEGRYPGLLLFSGGETLKNFQARFPGTMRVEKQLLYWNKGKANVY
jgi:hypothetical protein